MMIVGVLLIGGLVLLGCLNLVQRRALRAALHDPLTGLATRQLWISRAVRAMQRPAGLVLLLVDGDGIKQVNDRYGHDAGDVQIAVLAQRLQTWAGTNGQVGRLGGDEFVVFLRLPYGQGLADVLGALQSLLSVEVPYREGTLPASASVGAVLVDTLPNPTLSRAMRAADEAMYRAKSAGGGRWQLAEPCDAHKLVAEQAQAKPVRAPGPVYCSVE